VTTARTAPTGVRIRMYQVGFGDCFLLTFTYRKPQRPRHVLIDFGTTETPGGSTKALLASIAANIRDTVGSDPFAVVATHRHTDHVAGFDPGIKGDGPGMIIAALKPTWVIQPWTEQPDLAVDAKAPPGAKGMAARQETLASLHDIARHIVERDLPLLRPALGATATMAQLAFIGQDNITNARAVKNLMTMGRNDYVHAGKATKLQTFLPGVKVHVLGPPTVRQQADVAKERASDPDEFWQMQARALGTASATGHTAALFGDHPQVSGNRAPPWARWTVQAMRQSRGDQLLGLVRSLDKAMNNTSVVLLFEFGKHKLLFPGDAQIENWEYALAHPTFAPLLRDVSVYKVGHHGSRNATPKTLWNRWFPDDPHVPANTSMTSMMSTRPGKHGDEKLGTEVPRESLVEALKKKTRLVATDEMGDAPFIDEMFN
jgi:hypothetical protein